MALFQRARPPTVEAWVQFLAGTCHSWSRLFRMKMTLVKSLHSVIIYFSFSAMAFVAPLVHTETRLSAIFMSIHYSMTPFLLRKDF
jgi:hypothetical protein